MKKITILFGKDEINYFLDCNEITDEMKKINLKTYFLNTKEEVDAFIKGIEEGVGWQEAYIYDI
jgi:selenocysteine lyase/cysteine desulfurase